jgi:hypothetical protein
VNRRAIIRISVGLEDVDNLAGDLVISIERAAVDAPAKKMHRASR